MVGGFLEGHSSIRAFFFSLFAWTIAEILHKRQLRLSLLFHPHILPSISSRYSELLRTKFAGTFEVRYSFFKLLQGPLLRASKLCPPQGHWALLTSPYWLGALQSSNCNIKYTQYIPSATTKWQTLLITSVPGQDTNGCHSWTLSSALRRTTGAHQSSVLLVSQSQKAFSSCAETILRHLAL